MNRLESLLVQLSYQEKQLSEVITGEVSNQSDVPTCYSEEIYKYFFDDHLMYRQQITHIFEEDSFFKCKDYDKDITNAALQFQTLQRMQKIVNERLFSVHDLTRDPKKIFAFFESIPSPDCSLAMKLILHFVMYGGSILTLGSEYHHNKFLPGVDDLSTGLGCFAMTELGHGSNVRALQTTATFCRDTQQFMINTPHEQAQKYWIGNASTATRAVVFAQLYIKEECFGVHPFVVQLRDEEGNLLPGIQIRRCGAKGGVHGLDTCRIWFHQVNIPREDLLDRFGSVTPRGKYRTKIKNQRERLQACLAELITTRFISAIGGMNMARGAMAITTKYSNRRRQFGPSETNKEETLMSYRIHQLRLIPHIVDNYAINAFSAELKKLFVESRSRERSKELHVMVASLKIVSSEHVADAAQACRECCGGQGYLARNYVVSCRADSDVFKTLEADNLVLAQHVAGYAVSKFAETYGNGIGQLYYAGRWLKSFLEENPITRRCCDETHLLDKNFHQKAFLYREFHLARSLATRIRYRVEKGNSMFDVWNELGDHVTQLGNAFIERCVHESFVNKIDALEKESPIRPLLQNVCSFYALWHFSASKSWYLERGYITPGKSKAIRSLVNQLCHKISDSAELLVDGWNLPEYFFNDTIASSQFPLNHSYEATPWL